jgi:hypothetical protein
VIGQEVSEAREQKIRETGLGVSLQLLRDPFQVLGLVSLLPQWLWRTGRETCQRMQEVEDCTELVSVPFILKTVLFLLEIGDHVGKSIGVGVPGSLLLEENFILGSQG